MIKNVFNFFMNIVHSILSSVYKLFHSELTDDKWNIWKSFVKFLFVGFSNTIILFIVYYVIVFICGKDLYLFAQTAGYVAGIINSYFLNSRFVFSEGKRGGGSFVRMCICYGITYVVQMLLLYLQVDVLNFSEFIAPVVAVIITTPINFILNKVFAFKIK